MAVGAAKSSPAAVAEPSFRGVVAWAKSAKAAGCKGSESGGTTRFRRVVLLRIGFTN